MIVIVMSLMLAGPDGPPPYRRSLACAGLTRAWAELEAEGRTPAAAQAEDDAMFWAFAVMDAARRDGVPARTAEDDQVRTAKAARSRFDLGDDDAARELLDCQMMIPKTG